MIQTPKELTDRIRDRMNEAAIDRTRVATAMTLDMRFYEGHQWETRAGAAIVSTASAGRRIIPNTDPDSSELRVTQNDTTMLVSASAAATFPMALEPSAETPERDGGVASTSRTQVLEDTTLVAVEKSGLLSAARMANFMRCVCGVWGVGWSMQIGEQEIDGEKYTDRAVRAFDFHPMRLALDPACQSGDLRDHDEILYEDVWSVHKLRSVFPGLKIDENQLSTIGQLAFNEVQIGSLTALGGYGHYAKMSRTKGARVFQLHVRDPASRTFPYMYIAVDLRRGEEPLTWVNSDDPATPFGGDGLPLALIHAYPRPNSWQSISDVAMVRDDQVRMNLVETYKYRVFKSYAGPQNYVERAWFGSAITDDEIQQRMNNRVGGLVIGSPPPGRQAERPQIVTPPQPSVAYSEESERARRNMSEKVSRSPQARGFDPKTHVPFQTTDRLLNEGDRVLSIRVNLDLEAYTDLQKVLLGTYIKNVQAASPSTLGILRKEGFDEHDIGVLLEADPVYPTCVLKLRESDVRHRPVTEKQQAIIQFAQIPNAMDPEDARRALTELDVPVTEEDRHMSRQIGKIVSMILDGMEWQPRPIGRYGAWLVAEMRRALLDRKALEDPAAAERLTRAIVLQQQSAAQESAMVQSIMQPAQQPQPQPAQPEPATVGEMLDQMASQTAA